MRAGSFASLVASLATAGPIVAEEPLLPLALFDATRFQRGMLVRVSALNRVEPVTGKILQISPESLTLRAGGKQVTFDADSVRKLEVRVSHGDARWKTAIIGASAGVVLAVPAGWNDRGCWLGDSPVLQRGPYDCRPGNVAFYAGLFGAGLGVTGYYVGKLIKRERWEEFPHALPVQVQPRANGGWQASVRITFGTR